MEHEKFLTICSKHSFELWPALYLVKYIDFMDFWHATIQIWATEQWVGLLRVKYGVRQGYIIVYTCYLPCVRTVEFASIFIPLYKVLYNERDWVYRGEDTGSRPSLCKFKSQVKRLRSIVPSIHTMAEWYNVVVMFERYVIINLLVYSACIDSGQIKGQGNSKVCWAV